MLELKENLEHCKEQSRELALTSCLSLNCQREEMWPRTVY